MLGSPNRLLSPSGLSRGEPRSEARYAKCLSTEKVRQGQKAAEGDGVSFGPNQVDPSPARRDAAMVLSFMGSYSSNKKKDKM